MENTSARTSEDGRDQQCTGCLQWFRRVASHRKWCKRRPTQSSAEIASDKSKATRRVKDKKEPEAGPDPNHSATKPKATSFYFNHNVLPPEDFKVKAKLKLPPATSKKWLQADNDLALICTQYASLDDPVEGLRQLECTIYEYLLESLDETNKPTTTTPRKSNTTNNRAKENPKRVNDPECRRLRILKN